MGVYLEDPDQEQLELLSYLFEQWCKRGQSLHHMFEIIESHESPEVRDLVLKHLRESFPNNEQASIIELWITHPIPVMRSFITDLVDSLNISTPLEAAAYVMLDDLESLNKIDPDFHHLDIYLRELDPLLGSLLFQRVDQLKNPDLWEEDLVYFEEEEDQTLTDLIRKRDFVTLWENVLDYPLPFIAELLKILYEEDWEPVDESGIELYEILLELLGTQGWYAIDQVKWIVVSKKEGGKFVSLTPVDISRREMILTISSEIMSRPDRIRTQKFQSRGRFNLTDPELGLHIYMETVRRSDFDGMIHIPIYSNNGVELAEFAIPATSEKDFVMDEDGLYFSVRNKQGIISVDIDALAAILLPVSRHPEGVNEVIPILLERANEDQKLPLEGLNLLSTLHRGREFSLWDLKEIEDWDIGSVDELSKKGCQCTFAIDVGNTTTKISRVVYGTCDHKPENFTFPTVIYYRAPEDFIIGNDVIKQSLAQTSQTFTNIKAGLRMGNRSHIRIQNKVITSYDAFRDFIVMMLHELESLVDGQINSVALTYPIHAPSGFEAWLRSILQERGYERLEIIDELSATVIATYRLENQRDNVLILDIGSSQMGAVISKLSSPKSRKRTENTRMREDFSEKPEIIARLSTRRGGRDISYLLYDLLGLQDPSFEEVENQIESVKTQLSRDFEAQLTIDERETRYSLNNLNESGLINVYTKVEQSEVYQAFKLLIRNILVKGNQRGLGKDKIDTVLINGKASNWPMFLKYIDEVFSKQEIILETDHFLTAKGAGLLANGQMVDYRLEQDYLLKVTKNGIVSYTPVLQRGEEMVGKSKLFEIRPNGWMDKISLDCWTRLPKFVVDKNTLPLKDDEEQQHRRDHDEIFTYDRVFRKIVDIDDEDLLHVMVSKRGTLYFNIGNNNGGNLISTDTTVL